MTSEANQFDHENAHCVPKDTGCNDLYETVPGFGFVEAVRIWGGQIFAPPEEASEGWNASKENRAMFLPEFSFEVTP